jgi:hypothetical protein
LSMMATSLAIAPATATCGSGTIASLAFIRSICPCADEGQVRSPARVSTSRAAR